MCCCCPLTKHSGKYGQAESESGLRAGAQLSSGIYADADRNVANGFILSPTAMLKWESRLAALFFYATVAVLKQSSMLKKSRTERNSVRDSLEL